MTQREPMIRLDRFEKRFGKVHAVKPIDLAIERGETFALLGPNGSGKTTIIRAIVGLHRPSGGHIRIDGIDVVDRPNEAKAQLSYAPQRVTMPDMLTAREVASLFGRLKDVPESRVDEVLDLFGLADSADRKTREFSGGMLQRLGLAVAFLKEVPLLVLDEPTVNLDLLGVDRLRHLMGEAKARGTTVVFSSHLVQSAMQLADRVAVLVEGSCVTLEEAPVFRDAVARGTTVRVVLDHTSEAMVDASRRAGAVTASRNGHQLFFTAAPEKRLEIIRAIESAGADVVEIHTEIPDWTSLLRKHFDHGDNGRVSQ
ncbi:MAG: ATP-binding cassette domain-containing protein [Acidobacteria bacterium]|nr:ATP-binding cassette domain-containing protein [Acidobacteriota bacterium]NIM62505.1 ATP-binding cassette domain-containing protein [Acidobacteriota bacterium]NIO60576.1 ATP-binding cassette domain-containing protein [Acidobacteriota bacterium]NIQ29311.1 ATP-binding cassette domain-containing protein [Acidobacteriota bacterium]NIQ83911.1 ATP-binding cassette domain-containing protein [Acidobacteriota bacterium]